MALPKFTDTYSFNFDIEPVSIIKDTKSLTKRASAKNLLKYAKTKGQTDLHLIAVGAYEGTGFNRNMDRFMAKWCEKNAHYFQDANRCVHRHHKNKPDSPKYGNVKAAAYNGDMKRIELIVGLDDDKCSDILHEQEKVGHTNWSMASKQAYDICTWCDHKAYTDEDRCSHIPDKLGEMNKQGAVCGMDNPDPRWFEISYVKRPADRIGMSLGKVASAFNPMLPRDYLNVYTDFSMPTDELVISKHAASKRVLLQKLSEFEKRLDALSVKEPKLTSIAVTDKIAAAVMDELRKLDPRTFFKAASDKGIILSADNFFSYVFGDKVKQAQVEGVKTHLKDIFQMIEKDASIINSEVFEFGSAAASDDVKRQIGKLAGSHSIFYPAAKERSLDNLQKTASVINFENRSTDSLEIELAKQYANYKLAALNHMRMQGLTEDDLLAVAVMQNRV